MDIRDEHGIPIDTEHCEKNEQILANQYIEPDSVVLELGGRYGSVSCIINSKLNSKKNHVVVEPDERVWNALERNCSTNDCECHIIKGFISSKKLGLTCLDDCNGYGTTSIEYENTTILSFSLKEIETTLNLKFNTLVADCEGFLEVFFDENPDFYDDLKLIIFEADYTWKCDYDKIRSTLRTKGFVELLHGHQNVWKRML
jgi:hypothetical protein